MKCTLLAAVLVSHRYRSERRKKRGMGKKHMSEIAMNREFRNWDSVGERESRDRFSYEQAFPRGETDVVYSVSLRDVPLHSRISMNRNGLQLPIVRFCVSHPAGCRNHVALESFLRRGRSLRAHGLPADGLALTSNREYSIKKDESKGNLTDS